MRLRLVITIGIIHLERRPLYGNGAYVIWWIRDMMTSSNENIFRVTGHLCGEFTGHRWSPHTKASDAEFWCFFYLRLKKRLNKQSWGWRFETFESLVGRAVQGCCVVRVVVVVASSLGTGWLWSWSKMYLMLVAVVFRLLVWLGNISLLYTLYSPTRWRT